MDATAQQLTQFQETLSNNASRYDVELTRDSLDQISAYYQLVNLWNPRLHLVGPCTPQEFAQRHILESLLMLRYLTPDAMVTDIGSGAGLPVVPCLIVRSDLQAVLIESSQKKVVFLREALRLIERTTTKVIAERFEKIAPPPSDFISSRALDRFSEMLPQMLDWPQTSTTFLLFGGVNLGESLGTRKMEFETVSIPQSERRFLFVVKKT